MLDIGDATCIVISVCCISSGSLQLGRLVFLVRVPDSGTVLLSGAYNGAVYNTLHLFIADSYILSQKCPGCYFLVLGSFTRARTREISPQLLQGSIVCPLLFLCYVNDMVVSTDPDCNLLLYADDTTIMFSHTDQD